MSCVTFCHNEIRKSAEFQNNPKPKSKKSKIKKLNCREIISRILYTYNPRQKFYLIRISVLQVQQKSKKKLDCIILMPKSY